MRVFKLIGIAILLNGCATFGKFDKKCAYWVGRPSDELISTIGMPSSTMDLSDGKKLIEYVSYGGVVVQSNGYGSGTINQSSCKADFTVKDGIIEQYAWQGQCKSH